MVAQTVLRRALRALCGGGHVITLYGVCAPSGRRRTASVNNHLGFPEWITPTVVDRGYRFGAMGTRITTGPASQRRAVADFTGISHLDLSVSDVDASAEWYAQVLGLRQLKRSELEGRTMIVLIHPATGLVIGLNQHDTVPVAVFDDRNVGLDHVGFSVAERAELDELEVKLTALGVEHSPVEDTPVGTALVFRDPDNIQLEFWWTRTS